MSELLPLADAADLLGVSVERVRQLVVGGQLPGQRFGNVWVVPEDAGGAAVVTCARQAGSPRPRNS
jgi:hypothetical protein